MEMIDVSGYVAEEKIAIAEVTVLACVAWLSLTWTVGELKMEMDRRNGTQSWVCKGNYQAREKWHTTMKDFFI